MLGNKIGLGIVGSGRIGTLRARLASGHSAVASIAVSDLDPANAAKLANLVGARSRWDASGAHLAMRSSYLVDDIACHRIASLTTRPR